MEPRNIVWICSLTMEQIAAIALIIDIAWMVWKRKGLLDLIFPWYWPYWAALSTLVVLAIFLFLHSLTGILLLIHMYETGRL